jgi:hypothetical protein
LFTHHLVFFFLLIFVLFTLYTRITGHFHVNIARLQVKIHVTHIIHPIFILINLISFKIILSILHMGKITFECGNFIVDIFKFIVHTGLKNLLVQVHIGHGLSNVSRVVLRRTSLWWSKVRIKRGLIVRFKGIRMRLRKGSGFLSWFGFQDRFFRIMIGILVYLCI